MNTASRLYRITPAGAERPNHFVDSFESTIVRHPDCRVILRAMVVGSSVNINGEWIERVA